MENKKLKITFYKSQEEESAAEYERRYKQSPEDRMHEFSILQERCWGEKWTGRRIESIISYEMVIPGIL
jgi:hypothetical protein